MSVASKTGSWGNPGELLSRLCGRWSFERSIYGHGSMTGTATFTPIDNKYVAYREEGTLRLTNGAEVEAEQEYIYGQRQDGFDVFFKENSPRLFQGISLAPSSGAELHGGADHLCGEDCYRSTYEFLANGQFVIRHVVRGPCKDYAMVTTYFRLG